MGRSVLLRLVESARQNGDIVGRAHDISTGRETIVRELDELVAFLASLPDEPEPTPSDGDSGGEHAR